MKTLLEQVINELKVRNVSTGKKLKLKTFAELEEGDKMYFAFISPGYKLNQSGEIFKKKLEGSKTVLYWNTGQNGRFASIVITEIPDYLKVVDGNLVNSSGCVLKSNKEYWVYSTHPVYFDQKLKELFNLTEKDLITFK